MSDLPRVFTPASKRALHNSAVGGAGGSPASALAPAADDLAREAAAAAVLAHRDAEAAFAHAEAVLAITAPRVGEANLRAYCRGLLERLLEYLPVDEAVLLTDEGDGVARTLVSTAACSELANFAVPLPPPGDPRRHPRTQVVRGRDPRRPGWQAAPFDAYASAAATAVTVDGSADGPLAGTIIVLSRLDHEFSAVEVSLLELVASRLGCAMSQERLLDRLRVSEADARSLARRLVGAQEAESRRLARELHDQVGQTLTALALELGHASTDPSRNLDRAKLLSREVLRIVRGISLDLRPPMLDDLGLLPALLWLVERQETAARRPLAFAHTGLNRRFPSAVESAAFRIVQEGLTNTLRHGGIAPRLRVVAVQDSLVAEVADRGPGFDLGAPRTSVGVDGMRERAAAAGGTLEICSAPGLGTSVVARFPLGSS